MTVISCDSWHASWRTPLLWQSESTLFEKAPVPLLWKTVPRLVGRPSCGLPLRLDLACRLGVLRDRVHNRRIIQVSPQGREVKLVCRYKTLCVTVKTLAQSGEQATYQLPTLCSPTGSRPTFAFRSITGLDSCCQSMLIAQHIVPEPSANCRTGQIPEQLEC